MKTLVPAPHFGCFLCPEAVEAARQLGVLNHAFGSHNWPCYLTGKKEGNQIVEIKHGSDRNVMMSIVMKMFDISSSK